MFNKKSIVSRFIYSLIFGLVLLIIYAFSVSTFFVEKKDNPILSIKMDSVTIEHQAYWTDENIRINDFELSTDKELIVVGTSWSIENNDDIWISRLSTQKNKYKLIKLVSNKYRDEANFILRIDAKHFIAGGMIHANNENSFTATITSNGWGWKIGEISQYIKGNTQELYSADINNKNEIVTVGFSKKSPNGMIQKRDYAGEVETIKFYGKESKDFLLDVVTCDEDDYFCIGTYGGFHNLSGNKYTNKDADIFLLRTDAKLNVKFEKAIDFGGHDFGKKIIRLSNNSFLIVGSSQNDQTSFDYFLANIDAEGNILWSKTYGDAHWDYAEDMIVNAKNIVLLGTQSDEDNSFYIAMYILDLKGNVQKTIKISTERNIEANAIKYSNGSYYISGNIIENERSKLAFITSFTLN